jgi:hypothetical protein
VPQVFKVDKEQLVHKDHKVQIQQVLLVLKVHKDPQVQQDFKVDKALKDLQDPQELKDQQEVLVLKVQ